MQWYNLLAGGMGGTSSFYYTFTISAPIYFADTNYVLLRRRFLFGAIAPPPHARIKINILRGKNRKREHKARLPYLQLWERGVKQIVCWYRTTSRSTCSKSNRKPHRYVFFILKASILNCRVYPLFLTLLITLNAITSTQRVSCSQYKDCFFFQWLGRSKLMA